MHTSPLAQPGTGYAGGMNVYVHELSQTMAERDVEVTVFTRKTGPDHPAEVVIRPGYRIVHITAGPEADLRVEALPEFAQLFAEGVLRWFEGHRVPDLVHSHYWLSGWSGALIKETLGIPLVNSFHTLGRVHDRTRREGEPAASPIRALTEDEVLARTEAVVASTPFEVADLITHYGAEPERLFLSPPGVDHLVFGPGMKSEARSSLGFGEEPLVLYAGRIQAQKGIDVAVEALAKLPERVAAGRGAPRLVVVGGPSGRRGEDELRFLLRLAAANGVADRVEFRDPVLHPAMATYYQAADALVMPSRAESFGLVAAEAQACGLPVVASNAGGLRHVVAHDHSGWVTSSIDPTEFADALVRVLDNPPYAARLGEGAIDHADRFSWRSTTDRLLDLYADVSER